LLKAFHGFYPERVPFEVVLENFIPNRVSNVISPSKEEAHVVTRDTLCGQSPLNDVTGFHCALQLLDFGMYGKFDDAVSLGKNEAISN
jgi:hypothetical protein